MCREQLPVWQMFYEAHRNDNFEILAIAMDAQGAEVACRVTEAAGVEFTTAIDHAQGLWELYGFGVVPNGFLVDEQGILRCVNIGGFEVRNPEHAQAIEDLLAEPAGEMVAVSAKSPDFRTMEEALREAADALQHEPGNLDLQLNLAKRQIEAGQHAQARQSFEAVLAKNPHSARALVGLATVYLDLGEQDKASDALKQAWAIEPDNWIIRKQIWAAEYPEEFCPAINTRWQREQIQKEKAAEE